MFKKIVLGVLLVVVAILAYAATKPDTLRVERSTSINAPPENIFPLIDDFHRWEQWSPYEEMDLAMKKTYSGAPSGTGAVYEWQGNNQVGSGRMEIIDSARPTLIKIKLDFLVPFETHNTAELRLEPHGESTTVTWAMYGPNLFLGKVMSIFVDMDSMIGTDFEAGLANLKAVAEK